MVSIEHYHVSIQDRCPLSSSAVCSSFSLSTLHFIQSGNLFHSPLIDLWIQSLALDFISIEKISQIKTWQISYLIRMCSEVLLWCPRWVMRLPSKDLVIPLAFNLSNLGLRLTWCSVWLLIRAELGRATWKVCFRSLSSVCSSTFLRDINHASHPAVHAHNDTEVSVFITIRFTQSFAPSRDNVSSPFQFSIIWR